VVNKNDRYVVKTEDGQWDREGGPRRPCHAILPTQGDAEARAKEIVHNLGGGEVRIQAAHGGGIPRLGTPSKPVTPASARDRKH